MAPAYCVCWLPRRGSTAQEYEDAFAGNAATGRYAVADGASESAFAGLWARLLVDEFVHSAPLDADRWKACLGTLQERCRAKIAERPLPWYAEAKLAQGAFATLLGVAVTAAAGDEPHWQALAVGDTCLFHTRGGDVLRAFPLEHSSQFNSGPKLVGSRTAPPEICDQKTRWTQGTGRTHDRLWLMTDALAQWCLAQGEAGRNPWNELESVLAQLKPQQQFAAWIEELRATRQLHNDDVTLLAVRM